MYIVSGILIEDIRVGEPARSRMQLCIDMRITRWRLLCPACLRSWFDLSRHQTFLLWRVRTRLIWIMRCFLIVAIMSCWWYGHGQLFETIADVPFPGTFGSVTSLRVHMWEGKVYSFRVLRQSASHEYTTEVEFLQEKFEGGSACHASASDMIPWCSRYCKRSCLCLGLLHTNWLGQGEKILTLLCMARFPNCHWRAQLWQFPS